MSKKNKMPDLTKCKMTVDKPGTVKYIPPVGMPDNISKELERLHVLIIEAIGLENNMFNSDDTKTGVSEMVKWSQKKIDTIYDLYLTPVTIINGK